MRKLDDYSDERLKGARIHCGRGLSGNKTNKEHLPTKSLLTEPYADQLDTFAVHPECNTEFSLDEEYFCAFLASVISGSTEPDRTQFPAAARALRHSPALRRRIVRSRRVQATLWEGPTIIWEPEIERVNRVLVKNARGHALYELGEQMLDEPFRIVANPLSQMPSLQRAEFENGIDTSGWPEVGSRLMQRIAFGDVLPGGWNAVQRGVYRFAVSQDYGGVRVRIVLHECLAAEVVWD